MWSMDKGTRWKFTSQKRCSEPLPYGHGSERLWISTLQKLTADRAIKFELWCGLFTRRE